MDSIKPIREQFIKEILLFTHEQSRKNGLFVRKESRKAGRFGKTSENYEIIMC